MNDYPPHNIEEDSLAPHDKDWQAREDEPAGHPPTGALKQDSLLRTLAEEALAKGNPVLVIPLDATAHSAGGFHGGPANEETDHDLRLPKNTTVIFSGTDSLPALATGAPNGKFKVLEKSGDLGKEASESSCSSNPASTATPVRVVDPEDPDSLRWSPLEAEGRLLTPHNVILASSGQGKIHSQGARKAGKKRLSLEQVKHLKRSDASEESR